MEITTDGAGNLGFVDLHVHTAISNASPDMTPEFLRDKAKETGVRFAVAEHSCCFSFAQKAAAAIHRPEAPRLFDESLSQARDRIDRYLEHAGPCLSGIAPIGIELDVNHDGRFIIPDGYIQRFWPVIGSIHCLLALDRKESTDKIEQEFRQRTTRFAESGLVQAIGHPFRLLVRTGIGVSESLLDWTIALALDKGFALEINASQPMPEMDTRMALACARAGARVSIGTDAHMPEQFGDFSYHQSILRAVARQGIALDNLVYAPDLRAAIERAS